MNALFGSKKNYVVLGGCLIGILLGIVKISFGLGFLTGLAISVLSTILLDLYTKKIMFLRNYRPISGYLFFLSRNLFLLVPFIFALKWPTYFNIFTAIAGILYFKVILFGSVFIARKDA